MTQDLSLAFKHDTDYLQIVSEIINLPIALWSDDMFWVNEGMSGSHPCEEDTAFRARLESGFNPFKPTILFEDVKDFIHEYV